MLIFGILHLLYLKKSNLCYFIFYIFYSHLIRSLSWRYMYTNFHFFKEHNVIKKDCRELAKFSCKQTLYDYKSKQQRQRCFKTNEHSNCTQQHRIIWACRLIIQSSITIYLWLLLLCNGGKILMQKQLTVVLMQRVLKFQKKFL